MHHAGKYIVPLHKGATEGMQGRGLSSILGVLPCISAHGDTQMSHDNKGAANTREACPPAEALLVDVPVQQILDARSSIIQALKAEKCELTGKIQIQSPFCQLGSVVYGSMLTCPSVSWSGAIRPRRTLKNGMKQTEESMTPTEERHGTADAVQQAGL